MTHVYPYQKLWQFRIGEIRNGELLIRRDGAQIHDEHMYYITLGKIFNYQ